MTKKPNKRLIDAMYHYYNSHSRRVSQHYVHAYTKYPYFCDALFSERRKKCDGGAENHLKLGRKLLKDRMKERDCDFIDVADCELAEMFAAYSQGDEANAVEECYDAIAVLLRVIDVLEGRQELGRPERGDLCHEN